MRLALGAITSVVLLVGIAQGQATSPEAPAQSAESYAVYSVLIPHIQSLPQTKFLIAGGTVPYADTRSSFPVEPANMVTSGELEKRLQLSRGTPAWSKVWKGRPCVLVPEAEREKFLTAMEDYRRKNEISIPLARRLVLPKSYELVDVGGLNLDEKREYASANGAAGLYEVSAVGFSADMTTAIVYVGFDCLLCGRWALHVLRKIDGKWQEVALGCGTES